MSAVTASPEGVGPKRREGCGGGRTGAFSALRELLARWPAEAVGRGRLRGIWKWGASCVAAWEY